MSIGNKDRFCNASVFEGKKQALKDFIMANILSADAKWVGQKSLFEALKETAFGDIITTALVSDAIEELKAEGSIITDKDGFPADPA